MATPTVQSQASSTRFTFVQWVITIIAAIGFAFDSYVLLMLPLIVRPALVELLGVPPTSQAINDWVGLLQFVPAVVGGLFGMMRRARWAEEQQQQQQAYAMQQQSALAQGRSNYNRAFSVCMTGRGYTVSM